MSLVTYCQAVRYLALADVIEDFMKARVIQVKVKPNSRASLLEQREDGTWFAQIKSPPVEGKANEELLALVAKHFRCHKSDVSIKAGASGRMKLVRIEVL